MANRDREQVAAYHQRGPEYIYGNIDALVSMCHSTAVAKGWWDEDRSHGEVLMLIVTEVAECMEAVRAGNPISEKIAPFSMEEEELADILIRVFDYAGHRGFDLDKALIAKMKHNDTREYRHGGKLA